MGTQSKGTITDSSGRFIISGVAPGRYDVSFSFVGYAEYVAPNVEVTSGKEIVLDIGLETVSGRSFTMEEVNRYSGGRSDPSSLAANFAGVSAPDDFFTVTGSRHRMTGNSYGILKATHPCCRVIYMRVIRLQIS